MNRIILTALVAWPALLAGCAAAPDLSPAPAPAPAARPAPAPVRPAPSMDGGIVGTGNQLDCEPRTAKDGTPVPLPAECRR